MTYVYSKKIASFIQEVKATIKSILSQEVRLKVSGDWFMDKAQKNYHLISVVIYNDRNDLGYFDPNLDQLGFHEKLMTVNKNQLHNMIRHELAHYLTCIENEYLSTPHGFEFRAFCEKMGWGEEVYRATSELTQEEPQEDSDILRKVQKLMALSNSSNQHEAELAMIKSQQLLLKHNIDAKYVSGESEEKVYLQSAIIQSQRTAKMSAMARILETFFVSVVYSRKKDGTHLEILGSLVNVQIAQYVADVLQDTLEDLWNLTKREHNLKGATAKNSFFRGIAKGYTDKINSLRNSYDPEVTGSLMVIEGKIKEAQNLVYKRLTSATSSVTHCQKSSELGQQAGKHLNINPGIERSSKLSNAFISYKK